MTKTATRDKWWMKTIEDISHDFNTDFSKGLSEDNAHKRLQKYGFNEIKETKKTSALHIFVNQFSNFMVWVLITAILQIAIIYIPILQHTFHTTPLSNMDWGFIVLLSLFV